MKRTTARNENDRIMKDFANLGISEVVLLGRYHYSHAHSPLKPHAHNNIIEVCLLERGAQTYVVGSTRYDLTGGDVFITQPGEVHGTGHEPEGRGRLYWLEFKVLKKGQSFLGLTPQESQTLLKRFLALPSRLFRKGDMLAPTFERILAACADQRNPLQKADVRNLLLRLVLDIIAVAERQIAQPYSAGIQNAIRFIEREPATWPTLTQLARAASMSESHFKLTFKKETGMPPIEYGMWRRIEKAKHLLRVSNQPVTRIAAELGFSTSQHFATVFKRLTSLTPKAFRKNSHQHISDISPAIGAGPGFHPEALSSHR
ncbi:MAG: AraC family transcriptional regulator [bacterium]